MVSDPLECTLYLPGKLKAQARALFIVVVNGFSKFVFRT
jgi:hypothetical protein